MQNYSWDVPAHWERLDLLLRLLRALPEVEDAKTFTHPTDLGMRILRVRVPDDNSHWARSRPPAPRSVTLLLDTF